jgi:hypothetical protein
MHEALLELHEILNDWCLAAAKTGEALEHLRSQHLTRVQLSTASVSNAWTPVTVRVLKIPLKQGYIESAQRDIDAVMAPAAPLAQRWSPTKRRQAARRTLRNLMRVYCADLLDEFESAVEARVEWVTAHRHAIDKALKHGIADGNLDRLIQETADTTTQLDTARENLKRLIQERYPMGSADAGNG